MNMKKSSTRLFVTRGAGSVLALIFCLLSAVLGHAAETDAVFRSERPAVEVMFVLDTTGSMGGLIAAAKEKIWSIANTLSSAEPAPDIRMGLVGYRDREDQYITVFTPLSADLDAVYAELMQFQANGGGDGPESVNQALHEAVTRTQWSTGPRIYRVIFLVGDAPPHMDYQDDVKYGQSCRLAKEKDIVINTIQCGTQADTRPVWREIAQLAAGQYFQVAQSGSAVLYDTPYDREIGALSRELDETRIYYGSAEHRAEMDRRMDKAEGIYAAAAPSAVAKRAIFNASESGEKNFLGEKELVGDVVDKGVAISDILAEELPRELQKMDQKELSTYVEAQGKTRKALQAKIDDLAKKRQAHIETQLKEKAGAKESSLDAKIYTCIQSQAAEKQIIYKDGPAY